jgi:hypothetical protein
MFSISLYHIQDLGQPVEIHMALADLAGEKRHVQADTRAASCKLPALYMQVTNINSENVPLYRATMTQSWVSSVIENMIYRMHQFLVFLTPDISVTNF